MKRCRTTSWVPALDEVCNQTTKNIHTHTNTRTHTHTAFAFNVVAAAPAATEDNHIWPWDSHGKRTPGLWKRGKNARQDCNCMFHLGFHSAAKTIAAFESQVCFNVRGLKARGGNWVGEAEGSESHREIQPLLIFPYNRTLMREASIQGTAESSVSSH